MLDENQLRLIIFAGVLVIMAVLEAALPKRERAHARRSRWVTNLVLVVTNSIVLKLLGPISAVLVAEYTLDKGWGMLSHLPLDLPVFVQLVLGVVLLDLAIYGQHVASHKIPMLWRFHKIHHADRDIDVTTGVRFHPIEAVLSMFYKCAIILLLGPIALAVVVFEIVLNASAMFNHANLKLPAIVDRCLRWIIVTPDMHRVHHSTISVETDSNYGFFLSCWDKLFKTYIDQPEMGHKAMRIGLNEYQSDKPTQLFWTILAPFKKTSNDN